MGPVIINILDWIVLVIGWIYVSVHLHKNLKGYQCFDQNFKSELFKNIIVIENPGLYVLNGSPILPTIMACIRSVKLETD